MKLKITILDKSCFVDLIDHDLNKEIIQKLPNANNFIVEPCQRPNIVSFDREKSKKLWSSLRNSYYNFYEETKPTREKLILPKKFDRTNKWTNTLHRVFTNALTHQTYYSEPIIVSSKALNFIHQINDTVHELEKYIVNSHIQRWRQLPVRWAEVLPINLDKTTIINIENFKNAVSDIHDVYILKQITGKDFITAYFDNDISNSWDVNNGEITYIGMCIDFKDDLKRIWNDRHFVKWASKGGYMKKIGYIPLGNISSEDKMLLANFIETLLKNHQNNIPCKIELVD
jgi:hypothetical protein